MKANSMKTLEVMYHFDYWLNKFPIGMRADIMQARSEATEFESLKDFILFGFIWDKTKQGKDYWSDLVS